MWFSSLPRSAWECIQTFVKAHSLLHAFELGMHSHAERGNEGCSGAWEREDSFVFRRLGCTLKGIERNEPQQC